MELAQIPDVTSKDITATGRYLFWSQVISDMYSGLETKNQPVAHQLFEVKVNINRAHNNVSFFRVSKDVMVNCLDSTSSDSLSPG